MRSTPLAFEHLIEPISPAVFFREYWEQRPLHIARDKPGYDAELFSVHDVDTVLQCCKPKYPRVKIGKNQKRGYSLEVLEHMDTMSVHDYGVPNAHNLYKTTETFVVPALPDNLSNDSKVLLVRRLIHEGLLTVEGHDPALDGVGDITPGEPR